MQSNGEKGLEDRLVATYGAFAGWGESVALGENEAAGTAFGRDNFKETSASMNTETNVFQVAVNLLLRYVSLDGDLPGGESLIAEQIDDSMADSLQGCARYSRFLRFLFHGESIPMAIEKSNKGRKLIMGYCSAIECFLKKGLTLVTKATS